MTQFTLALFNHINSQDHVCVLLARSLSSWTTTMAGLLDPNKKYVKSVFSKNTATHCQFGTYYRRQKTCNDYPKTIPAEISPLLFGYAKPMGSQSDFFEEINHLHIYSFFCGNFAKIKKTLSLKNDHWSTMLIRLCGRIYKTFYKIFLKVYVCELRICML